MINLEQFKILNTSPDDKIHEKEYEEQLKTLKKATPKVDITMKNGL